MICGPDQVKLAEFVKELKNSKFKETLINFFIIQYPSNKMVLFIGNKIVHLKFR